MNDLDTRLHDALVADAERAPDLPVDWGGPISATIIPIERSRHGRRLAVTVGSAAAVAAAVTGLAAVARPDAPAPSASTAPAWQPPGHEFPLVDLGPATESPGGPTVAALTRAVEVEGHPVQLVTTHLVYAGGDTAEVQSCTWERGSGGCRPEWNPATWSFGVTSSVDNGVATSDLLTIEGLPPEAAYVGYDDGDGPRWARPVAGFAAFPHVLGQHRGVTTWDAAGNLLATYDEAGYLASVGELERAPLKELSEAQSVELDALTRSSMAACLTERGGTLSAGGVATFPGGVDQLAVWDTCVAEVKATVAERVAELT